MDSGLKDYVGRSVQETLDAAWALTAVDLSNEQENAFIFGRSFWQALVRGGYQAAAYYIDCMRAANG
jgi:hypothetical protein